MRLAAVVAKPVGNEKEESPFFCIENGNRSQMSHAFAKLLGGDVIEAYSAGSKPSGVVDPKRIASMKEPGYDLSTHESKPCNR